MNKTISIDDNSFDLIRWVCALCIFLGHFITHFQVDSPVLKFIAYFIRGVPVFFFLSGFLVARSLERYDTKEFLIRRFFRIYPSLWVCIIINTILILCLYAVKPSLKESVIYFATQFTIGQFYTSSWLRGYGVGTPNGVLWTIGVDIQFYLVALLLAKRLKKCSLVKSLVLCGICTVLSFGIELANKTGMLPESLYKLLSVSIIPYLYIFLFGMTAYYHREKVLPFCVKWVWLFVPVYTLWQFMPDSVQNAVMLVRYDAVSTILLLLMVIGLGYRFGKHRMKTDYSYAFYLYHMVVINVVYHVITKSVTSACLCVVYTAGILAATLALAFFSVQIVDKRIAAASQRKVLAGGSSRKASAS